MTKRFTTKNIICSNYCVWDTDDKPYGNDEVVELLNAQQETIAELRKESYGNLDGLEYYRDKIGSLSEQISDLECKNEQLKKDNKEYIRGLNLRKVELQSWKSDVRELREQNCRLEKENEQLKQKLLSKEDIIQQMKIKLKDDYYTKWKKTNLNYIKVCEELYEENRAYEKLSEENEQLKKELEKICLVNELLSMDLKESEHELWKENEQLKKELEDWKSNCLSTIDENSILWNEIAIMREQGVKPSSAFEEYCSKFKGDVND